GPVAEGNSGLANFSATADPSAADLATLRYAYDFGDNGTFDIGGATYTDAVSAATVPVPANFIGSGPANRVIRAWVFDKDGGSSNYLTTIIVNNVAPTGTFSSDGDVAVGEPTVVRFTNVVDVADDLAAGLVYEFDFTVGGVTTTRTSTVPFVSFDFPDPGTYTVAARLFDKDSGVTSHTTTTTVTNVAPTGTLTGSTTTESGTAGVSFAGAAHPGQAANAAGFRYAYDLDDDGTFDIGDGTFAGSVAATTASLPAALLLDSGTRTVRARVIEVNGAFTDFTTTVVVVNVAPTGTLSGPAGPVRPGESFTVAFGGVSDPSPADTAAGFVYSFDTDEDGVFEVSGSTPNVTRSFVTLGTHTIVARVADQDGAFTEVTTTVVVEPPARSRSYAVGADAGGPARASLFRNGSEVLNVLAFDPPFTGGVRVAAGDVNGDGVADLIVGTGPGIATKVRALSGADGSELFSIAPFEEAFKGGVYVAAGDLDGDGIDEIAISPDEGGGPRVMIFRGGSFARSADFFGIDDANFRGGARVAFGDLNGDGRSDLMVAAGFGGGPRVTAYDGASIGSPAGLTTMFNLFVFEEALRNGAFVSAGDLDGDGVADVVAGGGPGGGPRVLGLSGADLTGGNLASPKVLVNFIAGDVDDRGGVRVAAKHLDSDDLADIVVGDGAGAGGRVKTYLGNDLAAGSTDPDLTFDATPGFTGGVFVG
ncbi:MAG TPA: VCBS repeat-containing protein, partial [Gemmataceae bacterium]|nr:VCBS repeat-containing protein [Gemmataceae bacterium]